jgi:glycosyltransferase involved in cell wall biosynthesis
MGLSVLLPIYINDNSNYFELSIESIFNQSFLPDEVVIVCDGPVSLEVSNFLKKLSHNCIDVKILNIESNVGLGNALKIGLDNCSFDIVARMDADDISLPNRFEIQYNFLLNNLDIDVVGSKMIEFENSYNDLNFVRNIPLCYDQVVKFSKFRNPLNHPSVMFRKNAVLSVNSYENVLNFEDYYLWLKMINAGCRIVNLDLNLLYYRNNSSFLNRRSGWTYVLSEFNFYRLVFRNRLLHFFYILINLILKLPIRVLPKFVLIKIYNRLLRINI